MNYFHKFKYIEFMNFVKNNLHFTYYIYSVYMNSIQNITDHETSLQSRIHRNNVSRQVYDIIATLSDMSTKDTLTLASALIAQ